MVMAWLMADCSTSGATTLTSPNSVTAFARTRRPGLKMPSSLLTSIRMVRRMLPRAALQYICAAPASHAGQDGATMQGMIDSAATTSEPLLDYPSGPSALPRPELLAELRRRVLLLVEAETDWLANLGNAAAEIFALVPGLNWAGWYLRRGDELVLGPFQGRPACVRIRMGRGVCGTA